MIDGSSIDQEVHRAVEEAAHRDIGAREGGDVADHQTRHASLPADDGAQERTAGCDLGRGRFPERVWTIPKERTKRSKAHNVYLSRQTRHHDRVEDLRRKFEIPLPSRYDADAPMSRATFTRVTYAVVEQAKKEGLPLEHSRFMISEGRDPHCSMNLASTATGSRSALRTRTAAHHGAYTTRQSTKFSAAT